MKNKFYNMSKIQKAEKPAAFILLSRGTGKKEYIKNFKRLKKKGGRK